MRSRESSSIIAPILLWSVLQIIALILSADHVQLWANPIHPAENYALRLMFATQLIVAAMLFPWLMRDLRSTIFVILITAPFLQLSGMLADESGAKIALLIELIWIWLIALAALQKFLTTQWMQSIALAITTCITVGILWIFYLHMEFGVQ